jgi:ceramide synthetase
MLLHDINDVLMEVAKSCNYLGLDSAATGVFALFVASWAALRITAFPLCIIRSTFLEVWRILGYRPPCHGVLNALLCSLYCIHIYWFTLILRIAWRKLTTGQSKDIREDDEDEHDD